MVPVEILIPFGVGVGAAALATPLVGRVAAALRIIDRPSERSVSRRENVPLLGGLAVACGFAASLAASLWIVPEVEVTPHLWGLLGGAALILALGIWDDRYGMSAGPKLAVQALVALIAISSGFQMTHITEPITRTTFHFSTPLVWGASLIWIIGITNAVNLIDGLDGLATGVGAIICATLTLIAWQAGQPVGVGIGLALLGGLLGFLPWNFAPARIFLGDTGSLFIGYALALLALEGYRQLTVITFVVPLLALAVPILDTGLSILRRVRLGTPVFSPDRLHLHHRLLARRGSARAAVLQFWFLTLCFCLIAVSFTNLEGYVAAVCLAFVAVLTLRLLWNLGVFSFDPQDAPLGQAAEEEKT
jgi:UDP-GlcNAc:undecaprenyl-phosphate GlcNAc-1-phosphate transferase